MSGTRQSEPLAAAGLLGLGHLAVESATVAAVVALAARQDIPYAQALACIAGYNALAFVTQPLLGGTVDRLRACRGSAVLGCLLAALGAFMLREAPTCAVVVCALGNALFHVGAGAMALHHWPRSATAQGLFVGPGDLGVLVGLLVGRGVWPPCERWFAIASLAAIVPLLAMPPVRLTVPSAISPTRWSRWSLALLIAAVMCRPATVGFLAASVRTDGWLLAQLYVVAAVAKCLGGWLADRWGWRPTMVLAAGLTAALVPLSHAGPAALLLAAALAQVPTGVTLAAIGQRLPAWPAAAFGLTTLFVYIGGPPALRPLSGAHWAVLVQAACAICLALALALAPKAHGAEGTRS
ncbi:MAG: hypothetical protein HZB16_05460 [Armatimonadetes bacterium]|nr:hypothetical protein [Armatimonadota bacterium]